MSILTRIEVSVRSPYVWQIVLFENLFVFDMIVCKKISEENTSQK